MRPVQLFSFVLGALLAATPRLQAQDWNPNAPLKAAGSPWNVRAWGISDGLPSDTITGVAQAPDGYLWMAASTGVARFDGDRFEIFDLARLPNPNRLHAKALLVTRRGEIWLGMTTGPVAILKPAGGVQIIADPLPSLRVDTLVEDPQGSVWVGYHSGPICRISGGQVTILGPDQDMPGTAVASLAVDTHGVLWTLRGRKLGIIDHDRFISKADLPTGNGVQIASGRDGSIWVCDGLRVFNYRNEIGLQAIGTIPGALRDQALPFEDHTGTLWIGTTNRGLFRYADGAFEFIPVSQGMINWLADDNEGNLWVGTPAGLDRVQPRPIEIEGGDSGLPLGILVSMCEDREGQLWGVTQDGTLLCRKDNHWSTAPTGLADPAQCVTADPAGGLWIGCKNGLLFRWRDGQLVPRSTSPIDSHAIAGLLVSKRGDLWFSAYRADRLGCLRNGQVIDFPLPAGVGHFDTLAEDADGNIWAAAAGTGGVVRIDPTDHLINETASIGGKSIRCLYASPDGALWIGYGSAGLGRLKEGRLAIVRPSQGLYESSISLISPDDRGSLWFGGDLGIFKVRLQELNALFDGRRDQVQSFHFGKGQELPALHARWGAWPSMVRSRYQRLWMPMETGLAIIHPERVREHPDPPPVYIERVASDDHIVAAPATRLFDGVAPPPGEVVALSPDFNRLQIEFTALSFAAPENMRFRYRLDGFDKAWVSAPERRIAIYPRLPAGEYLFHVVACNGDGVWNETGARLSFAVAPFMTQTWWFRCATAIVVLATLLLLVRYISFRRLRTRLRMLEYQTAVARERTRIARDLHDDLGARLTKIIMWSERSLSANGQPGYSNEFIPRIATAARQAIKSLDETVWAVSPRNDTLADTLNYIGQNAVEFLRAANIRCRVRRLEQIPNHVLASEVRHHVLLVVKETLNNIVRHAQATEVVLHVTQAQDTLCLLIEDNGRGFDHPPDDAFADGLRNMRQRMEDIGGRLDIQSIPGTGTRISLFFPWSRRQVTARETKAHDGNKAV